MSAATLQHLLDWFATPSVLQPKAVPNAEAPAYPDEATLPAAEQLRSLKELLSPEVWLYLLCADDETPRLDQPRVQRELQAHIARVLDVVGQDLRDEPLTSPRLRTRFTWVQYQLLHAPPAQVPTVYYEQAVRAWLAADRHYRHLHQSWQALSSAQQAAYASVAPAPATAEPSAALAPAPAFSLAPRTGFLGDIYHPGFGEWLVLELTARTLPEIDAYLTLTWVFVTPEAVRPPGDFRRPFAEADIPYLLDLLDGDWSSLAAGGRPQIIRARKWFGNNLSVSANAIGDAAAADEPAATPSSAVAVLAGMTAKQIALFHIYEGLTISTVKAKQIAAKAGFDSGTKVYQRYLEFRDEADRQCVDGKKRLHLITDIKAVLGRLSPPAKKRAENDLFALMGQKTLPG